jgi:hypothetical protein
LRLKECSDRRVQRSPAASSKEQSSILKRLRSCPTLRAVLLTGPAMQCFFTPSRWPLNPNLLSQNVPLPRVKRVGRNHLQRLERRAELRGLRLTELTVQRIREMSKARFDDHPRDPGHGAPYRVSSRCTTVESTLLRPSPRSAICSYTTLRMRGSACANVSSRSYFASSRMRLQSG